ncbi:MAG: hypothetical protein AVO35_11545 [Candidatus Aegiribacteria sp. MLS_C]|nr:MAG: hypothetical protein AVO35_11545 [Candidatus Aegiribacteria sp. MLS_C]
MRGFPTAPWGKLRYDDHDEVEAWHPLEAHCADVAACLEALLRHTLMGNRLACLASQDRLSESQVSRLCVIAGLHDMGKFNHGFQAKALRTPHETAGHVREMLALMYEKGQWTRKLVQALSYEEMVRWGDSDSVMFSLLTAAVSHHGRPQTPTVFRSALWKESGGTDPIDGIRGLRELLQTWYPEAWSDDDELLPDSTEFQHAFYGLLTLADWIGSDEELFPFAEHLGDSYIDHARDRAKRALSLLWLDPRSNIREFPKKDVSLDLILPDGMPFPVQQSVLLLDSPSPGSITIIEAETGSGKTEAALLHFLRLFRNGQVDGLYFALPTRTAATQIHRRVTKAVENAFLGDIDRPPVVMAVPGYLQVDDRTLRRLAPFRVLWNDDDDDRTRYRSWAAERPKRYLAGSISVGTIDQVLLSSLQVNHSHMRAAALLRQLLVVDEVHASDRYMNQLLKVVLERHVKAGGHALLMSATLGCEMRKQLLGLGLSNKETLDQAISEPYPLVSMYSGDQKIQLYPQRDGRRKSVEISIMGSMGKPDDIADEAVGMAANGGRIIVLRNTIASCIATQEAVERSARSQGQEHLLFNIGGSFAPHHSRFARPDRQMLDNELEAQYGKELHSGGMVLVATQTVQQSLDLDADLLITDLCPMDVLLQRAGRLHRHPSRDRPGPFSRPRLIVLVPEERDMTPFLRGKKGEAWGPNGLGTVYEDLRMIEATWSVLEKRKVIEIPDDNRYLVESSLHSDVLKCVTERKGGPWVRHQQHVHGSSSAEGLIAEMNVSNWSDDFLSRDRILFSGSSDRHISTRLGAEDRLAVFDAAVSGPFGRNIEELTIPSWMASDARHDERPEDVRSDNGSITFRFGRSVYLYDRYGLRFAGNRRNGQGGRDEQ